MKKLICKAIERDGKCPYRKNPCPHGKPHKYEKNYKGSWGCTTSSTIHKNCVCIPVGLEYYMKEIIKKHEETKNEANMQGCFKR